MYLQWIHHLIILMTFQYKAMSLHPTVAFQVLDLLIHVWSQVVFAVSLVVPCNIDFPPITFSPVKKWSGLYFLTFLFYFKMFIGNKTNFEVTPFPSAVGFRIQYIESGDIKPNIKIKFFFYGIDFFRFWILNIELTFFNLMFLRLFSSWFSICCNSSLEDVITSSSPKSFLFQQISVLVCQKNLQTTTIDNVCIPPGDFKQVDLFTHLGNFIFPLLQKIKANLFL